VPSGQNATPTGSSLTRDVSLPLLAALLSLPFFLFSIDAPALSITLSSVLSSSASFEIPLSIAFSLPMSFQIPLPSTKAPYSASLAIQIAAFSPNTSPRMAPPQSQFFLELGEQ
jgi:hypothetical protein